VVTANRTWGYAALSKIAIGVVAAFMFGFAALLFSLPSQGISKDHSADWMVYLTGVILAGFGIFVSVGLSVALRTRISIDARDLNATFPDHHNWLLVPSFRSVRIPLTDIHSVELREEIFKTFGLSNSRVALSIVTASGERIGLVNATNGSASTLPVDDIAAGIAAAAGLPITDDGTVFSKVPGLYGVAASTWSEPRLDEKTAGEARRTVVRTMQIVAGLMLLGFVLRACL